MGCWNETDALTKLPIMTGDEAVMIVLESCPEQFFTPSRFVNESLYVPVSLPLYGTYDDYGSLDLHDEQKVYHQSALASVALGSDTPQEFLERISYDDTQGARGGVYTKMFFNRSVWESMLQKIGNRVRRPYSSDETIREYFEKVIKRVEEVYTTPNDDLLTREVNRMQVMDELSHTYRSVVADVFRKAVTPESREGVIRLALTDVLLTSLRLGWAPQFGSGSQDAELELTAALAGHTFTEINAIKKRYNN